MEGLKIKRAQPGGMVSRIAVSMLIALLVLGRQPVYAGEQEIKQPAIQEQKDIEYGQAEGESLRLDLYRPADDTAAVDSRNRFLRHPGLIFIHGGGWRGDGHGHAQAHSARGTPGIPVDGGVRGSGVRH